MYLKRNAAYGSVHQYDTSGNPIKIPCARLWDFHREAALLALKLQWMSSSPQQSDGGADDP